MSADEYLLVCLMEECAEVQQRASKALRFGLDERQPGQTLTNAVRLGQEISDLEYIISLLKRERSLIPISVDAAYVAAKKARFRTFCEYSREVGKLEG